MRTIFVSNEPDGMYVNYAGSYRATISRWLIPGTERNV